MSEILHFPQRGKLERDLFAAAARDAMNEQAAAKCMQIERIAYAISALADTPQRKYRAVHIAHLAKWLADEFDNTPPGGAAA